MKKITKYFWSLLAVASLVTSLYPLSPALAQVGFGLDETAKEAGFRKEDPELVIGQVINVAFGFLGLIAFVLVLWAGYLYMTAGGAEKQIAHSMDILKGAVYGLILIFISYAVTAFVVSQLAKQTLTN